MNKLLLWLSPLLLSACSIGVRPPPAQYDFGEPNKITTPSTQWNTITLEVAAPAWLNTTQMYYRLLYVDPFKREVYAQSRWLMPPAKLLAASLQQQLDIAPPNAIAGRNCLLHIAIQEFAQEFSAPDSSHTLINARITLNDAHHQRIAVKDVRIKEAAPTPDAAGGVKAFVQSSQALAQEITRWQHELHTAKQLSPCQDSAQSQGFSILSADFGIPQALSDDSLLLEPTTRINYKIGQNYGWEMKVRSARKRLRWKEELILPTAPVHWNVAQGEEISLSADRRIAVTEREVANTGILSNYWSIAPGDPKGAYTIRIYIDEQRVRTFQFIIE